MVILSATTKTAALHWLLQFAWNWIEPALLVFLGNERHQFSVAVRHLFLFGTIGCETLKANALMAEKALLIWAIFRCG